MPHSGNNNYVLAATDSDFPRVVLRIALGRSEFHVRVSKNEWNTTSLAIKKIATPITEKLSLDLE